MFSAISALFHTVLYRPLFNGFVALYNIIPGHNVGIVIALITIAIRLVVYPLTSASIKAQKSLQDLQPKLNDLKKKYATDQQQQATAIMQLYKEHKVNPFASCLPLLVQLPILIALYSVFRDGLASTDLVKNLYSFVANPGMINPVSFGVDMGHRSYVLAVLAGFAQYWQARVMSTTKPPAVAGAGGKDEEMMAMMNKQMLYMMPIMTVVIGVGLPAGLSLYWLLSTLLMVGQQYILFRSKPAKTTIASSVVVEGELLDK